MPKSKAYWLFANVYDHRTRLRHVEVRFYVGTNCSRYNLVTGGTLELAELKQMLRMAIHAQLVEIIPNEQDFADWIRKPWGEQDPRGGPTVLKLEYGKPLVRPDNA